MLAYAVEQGALASCQLRVVQAQGKGMIRLIKPTPIGCDRQPQVKLIWWLSTKQ
jgi:hypothetical protein